MNNRSKGFIKSAKTVGKVVIKTTGNIVASMLEEETCQAKGCNKAVSKAGYKLCYSHYKAANSSGGNNFRAKTAGKIVSTVPEEGTCQTRGCDKTVSKAGYKFCYSHYKAANSSGDNNFRTKFPAQYRTQDGHQVRSKAEVLIDNWLFTHEINHSYERKLPIAEDVYCDFYLPQGKVYIEYWGLENDPKYRARKSAKLKTYRQAKLKLIELTEKHIINLDDVFPQLLLKHGYKL